MKSKETGIKRILKAFIYSYNGFTATVKSEIAFRQDLIVFILLTPIAILLDISLLQKAILISSLLFILLMELINSAIETTIDRISIEYHELSKKAKDIGSLLVLISFINAIILWSAILYQKFF